MKAIIQHCTNLKAIEYTASDFVNVNSESDLVSMPVSPNPCWEDWFEMTEIQKVYLLGRC